jgi:hypothetical protein
VQSEFAANSYLPKFRLILELFAHLSIGFEQYLKIYPETFTTYGARLVPGRKGIAIVS